MAIDIVDLSIEHGGPFHSFFYVYQRVYVITKNLPSDQMFVGLTHIDILFIYYSLYMYKIFPQFF